MNSPAGADSATRQDAIVGLQDIHAPPPAPFWPPAPGWWGLGLLAAVAAAFALLRARRFYQRWRRRRWILGQLGKLYAECQQTQDRRAFAAGTSMLLRRVALSRFSPDRVAALQTERWLNFLDDTGGDGRFRREASEFKTAPYRDDTTLDSTVLYRLAALWLKKNL